jgi:hypothetical protein
VVGSDLACGEEVVFCLRATNESMSGINSIRIAQTGMSLAVSLFTDRCLVPLR